MEIFWILVAIIAVIVVGLIVYAIIQTGSATSSANPSQTVVPLTSPVSFGYSCKSLDCAGGFVCDPIQGVCKTSLGQPCQFASDCVSPGVRGFVVCSGVCVSGTPAVYSNNPNDPCPCGITMTCTNKTPGSIELACKLKGGQPCQQDVDCFSGACNNNTCSPGAPNGETCQQDNQCIEGNCSNGFCQPPGITTGEIGSSCSPTGAQCDAGFVCQTGVCNVPASALGITCSQSVECGNPLNCLNSSSHLPCGAGEQQTCICQYQFSDTTLGYARPDPNLCSVDDACSTGYICNAGSCLAPSGLPCLAGSNCNSGSCSLLGQVYLLEYLSLDGSTWTNDPTQALGSLDVRTVPQGSNFGPSNASRIVVGYPDPLTEEIFYVVPGSQTNPQGTGVLSLDLQNYLLGYFVQIDSTNTIQDEFTLIDAVMYDELQVLVAYLQVRTQNSVSTSNYVLYTFDGVNLAPFNVITGSNLPGTQFFGATPLTISKIDRSTAGDVLIVDTNNNPYVKQVASATYIPVRATTQPLNQITDVVVAKFYFDVSQNINIGDCSQCPSGVCSAGICTVNYPSWQNVGYAKPGLPLVYTGNLSEVTYPVYPGFGETTDIFGVTDFDTYSIAPSGTASGTPVMIAQNQTTGQFNLFLAPLGSLQPVPSYVDNRSHVLASQSSIYLYTAGSCA